MRIQIITQDNRFVTTKEIEVSRFTAPRVFDDFDINIIDFS